MAPSVVDASASGLTVASGSADAPSHAPHRSEYLLARPTSVLAFLCVVQFLLYYDRGVIASNGVGGPEGIAGEFHIDNTQDAFIGSIFIVGLVIFSPIFAQLAKRFDAFALVGVGLFVWIIAVLLCAASSSYGEMLMARAFVGCGEASFVSLAAPFLDAKSPPNRRAAWLALFYSFMPVGIALGFAVGGSVGLAVGWRAAFVTEAIAMVPLCAMGVLVGRALRADEAAKEKAAGTRPTTPDDEDDTATWGVGPQQQHHNRSASFESLDGIEAPSNARRRVGASAQPPAATPGSGTSAPASASASASALAATQRPPPTTFLEDIKTLSSTPTFVSALIAYTFYSMTPGVLAWWGPRAGKVIYNISMGFANTAFGAVTVIAGLLGSWLGGILLDAATSKYATPVDRSRSSSDAGSGDSASAAAAAAATSDGNSADINEEPVDTNAGPCGGVPSAFGICGVSSLICFCMIVPGFLLLPEVYSFLLVMFIAQVFLFTAQAPVIAGLMWSLPAHLRNLGIGMTMVTIHVFGDVPSPIVVGKLLDAVGSYRIAMAVGCVSLLPASILWAMTGARASRNIGSGAFRWMHAIARAASSSSSSSRSANVADETSPLLV